METDKNNKKRHISNRAFVVGFSIATAVIDTLILGIITQFAWMIGIYAVIGVIIAFISFLALACCQAAGRADQISGTK